MSFASKVASSAAGSDYHGWQKQRLTKVSWEVFSRGRKSQKDFTTWNDNVPPTANKPRLSCPLTPDEYRLLLKNKMLYLVARIVLPAKSCGAFAGQAQALASRLYKREQWCCTAAVVGEGYVRNLALARVRIFHSLLLPPEAPPTNLQSPFVSRAASSQHRVIKFSDYFVKIK